MATFQCATAPNTIFNSREELHEHYKSEWHRYNLRRRAAGLAPIAKDVFDKVRAMAASQEKTLNEKSKKKDHVASKNRVEPKKTVEQEEEEEDEEEPLEERVKKAIEEFEPDPCRCLFDDCVFNDVETNLEHMHKTHGFLIHDLDCVTNLTGMINYLAEKIQVGRICLNCEREFRTGQACVAHMEAKGHCNIPWEYEDDIEEFVDYYDFSTLEDEKKNAGTMEYDAGTGELILKDAEGKTTKRLGTSRAFREVYRSVHAANPKNAVESAISNAVKERSIQSYRRAGLSTSTALSVEVKKRLYKKANSMQERFERKFQAETYKNGMKISLLIKDRKAGTNVGAGHGVHG